MPWGRQLVGESRDRVESLRNFVAKEIMTVSMYSHRPPLCFLPYERSEAERLRVMRFTEKLFEVISVYQPLADKDPAIETDLKSALWPNNAFVLECLVGAKECGFNAFPTAIEKDLFHLARSLGSTVNIEYLHREVAIACRHANNKNLAPQSMWHRALFSGVMEDADRPQVKPTEEQRTKSSNENVKKPSFEIPAAHEFSLGDDALASITNNKDSLDHT
jgi:hypothetical protein